MTLSANMAVTLNPGGNLSTSTDWSALPRSRTWNKGVGDFGWWWGAVGPEEGSREWRMRPKP